MIGTLRCGEGDFPRCQAAIAAQTWLGEHLVVGDLPEVEAHLALYRAFKDSGAEWMVKVDADMVLLDDRTIERMLTPFLSTSHQLVSYRVHDGFTDSPIWGVNCYRSTIEFDWSKFVPGSLSPDRHHSALRPSAPGEPARSAFPTEVVALHAHYPTDLQAFRFGFNRRMKRQANILVPLIEHYRRRPDLRRLRMACLGVVAARDAGDAAHRNYGPDMTARFEAMSGCDWSDARLAESAEESFRAGQALAAARQG